MTIDERAKFLRTIVTEITNDPSFSKEVMDAVSFAMQQRVDKAIELAHQKDMAFITALSIINATKNKKKINKDVLQKLEQDMVVHGILCSSDYNEIQKRLQNVCGAELDFLNQVCEKRLNEKRKDGTE